MGRLSFVGAIHSSCVKVDTSETIGKGGTTLRPRRTITATDVGGATLHRNPRIQGGALLKLRLSACCANWYPSLMKFQRTLIYSSILRSGRGIRGACYYVAQL